MHTYAERGSSPRKDEMPTHSRREFVRMALAGVPLTAALPTTVRGVSLGVQTYSFRDFGLENFADKVIKAMTDIGLDECELQFPFLRPFTETQWNQMDQAKRIAA